MRSTPLVFAAIMAHAISMHALAPPALGGGTPLAGQLIASGLDSPLCVAHAPGDSARLFVVERAGKIRLIKNGILQSTPFLDITHLVSTSGERGCLGLAFHPQYASNGYFYVRYSDLQGETTVTRYTVSGNPDLANNMSPHLIVEFPWGTAYHNGGAIAFGADGYLYIGAGDGVMMEEAQLLTSWLGKIIRINVNGDDFPADPARNYRIPPGNPFIADPGMDEIWAYGLRNPYRFSFDRATGDMWIGDVGQGTWEEVSVQPAGAGGRNYGWPCREGKHCTSYGFCDCNSSSLTDPLWEYLHMDLGCAITGGVVYRGCAIPDLQGTYFCADYCTDRIFSFRNAGGTVADFQYRESELDPPGAAAIENIVGFGEDYFGEIYLCDLGGEVFKIVPASPPPDGNGNGIPDACEGGAVTGDLNGDGTVGVADLLIMLNGWGPCPAPPTSCPADIAPLPSGNGRVDVGDLLLLIANWR